MTTSAKTPQETTRSITLDDRYLLDDGLVYLTGIQALVRVPIDQHRFDRRHGLETATFISGYEGSPLAGYDIELMRQRELLRRHQIVHRPGLNEEIAATSVEGSQLASSVDGMRHDGVVGVWYGKAPGLDRATDAIRHANLMGTAGGVLALVGDDPLSKSSTVPSASEMTLSGLMLPTIYPGDIQDILDLCRHGIALSRASGLWVGVKVATNVADGSGTAEIHPDRIIPTTHSEPFPHRDRVTAKMVGTIPVDLERSAQYTRLEIAEAYAYDNELNRISRRGPNDLIGIAAAGKTYFDVCQALRSLGLDDDRLARYGIRLFKIGMIFPLEPRSLRDFASGLREIVVIEEKRSFIEAAVKEALYGKANVPAVYGKRDPEGRILVRSDSELDPDDIADAIARRLLAQADIPEARNWLARRESRDSSVGSSELGPPAGAAGSGSSTHATEPPQSENGGAVAPPTEGNAGAVAPLTEGNAGTVAPLTEGNAGPVASPTDGAAAALPIEARTPYFCSGCPHNRSTRSPDGSLVGAGIGCHAMVLLMEPDQVGNVLGLTQMGGEGAQWLGMAPFVEPDHLVQNIGDGTFLHSGSLAVRAAVASGVNLTYKILYNSAVAMTGGQEAVGAMPIPDLTRLLAAEGVKRIIVTTDQPAKYRGTSLTPGAEVWHRDRLEEAQRQLAETSGVTVLIHDQQCAAEKRRKRKRGKLPDPTTRVFINERVCEGCGDCGRKSNCLSVQPIETEFGRKTQIHQPSCNKDYSCLDGDCPSFLTVVPGENKEGTVRQAGGNHRGTVGDTARTTGESRGGRSGDIDEPEPRVPADRFAMRITGVGGTGVVTVAQVLGTAALIAGRRVRALDQTGLAQKGGAVVSDLKISTDPLEQANKLVTEECDLYLGCDLLVAADPRNLAAVSPERTVAVVSTTEVPTGRMVVDTTASFPEGIASRIAAATRAGQGVFFDARGVSEGVFGDDQYANILLAGAAYQSGALPLPLEAIEQAIRLNGAAVETNLAAFRYGRQLVTGEAASTVPEGGVGDSETRDVDGPKAKTGETDADGLIARVSAAPGTELARLVSIRVPDLVAYQDSRYATRYADLIERVRATEDERVPGSTELAETVARYLYKLMAYKDEYEVARLSLDPQLRAEITRRFGSDARFAWKLHPPILRAIGMKKKISLGSWFTPGFRALRAMRRLRGTPFDPFGRTEVRRIERELVAEYRSVVERILATLTTGGHELAIRICELPDQVRGYEAIKLANVARYREQLRDHMAQYDQSRPAVPR